MKTFSESKYHVKSTPGITNATIVFNYGVQTATDKSSISDRISRIYIFNVRAISISVDGCSELLFAEACDA